MNAQLHAEVAALRAVVAVQGSTSERSSQTDARHAESQSSAATEAKSERIAQLACAPSCPTMSPSPKQEGLTGLGLMSQNSRCHLGMNREFASQVSLQTCLN